MKLETNLETSRKGLKKYTENPFIADAVCNVKTGRKKITNSHGDRMMITSQETGEVVARDAGFWHTQEVDKSQFIKLYINGVKAFKELTSAGTKVFEVLYVEMQKAVSKDLVHLDFPLIDQALMPMSKTTFHRGIKEILIKGFIAESVSQNLYFINPDFVWNGNRLAFVKEYRLKTLGVEADTRTLDLFEQAEI